MVDAKDPQEVLDDDVGGRTNKALSLVGELGFGLLLGLAGLALVGWGAMLADDSLVAAGAIALFGFLVVAVGVWVARG